MQTILPPQQSPRKSARRWFGWLDLFSRQRASGVVSRVAAWLKSRSRETRIAAIACPVLLLVFAILSYSAVLTKSATYDEPMTSLGAWVHLHMGDFRINFEDPPLWQYWAALPNGRDAIQFDTTDQLWVTMPASVYNEFRFGKALLYPAVPGNDGATFVNRTRFMLMLLGVALGIVVTIWAWEVGGPIAAIAACFLFCLDPNFLAHSSLVKNDVPMSLVTAAVLLACWHVGKRLTWLNAPTLCLLVAVAVNTKFSALLLGPMIAVLLALRIALGEAWVVFGRPVQNRLKRIGVSAVLVLAICVVTYTGIWASYGFRFDPSPNSFISLNTDWHKWESRYCGFRATHSLPPIGSPFNPKNASLEYLAQILPAFAQKLGTISHTIDEAKGLLDAMASRDDLHRTMDRDRVVDLHEVLRARIDDLQQLGAQMVQTRDRAQSFLNNAPPVEVRAATFPQQLAVICEAVYTQNEILTARMLDSEYDLYVARWFLKPPAFIRVWDFLFDRRLFPSAWLHGVLFVEARSKIRGSYLFGEISETGWWYYFPVTMVLKAPLATLMTVLAAMVLGGWAVVTRRRAWRKWIWPLACLLVPFAFYMTSIMTAKLNIGVRHALPAYPMVFVTCGVLIAAAWRRWRLVTPIIAGSLGLMLLIEAAWAWPDYIAYFNPVFAGDPPGFKLLADSNLDWGQDLPLIKKWQDEHPDTKLALAMYVMGVVDPKFYGIKYDPVPQGPPPDFLTRDHVIVLGATMVQGVYIEPGTDYRAYQKIKPTEVLGRTVYLYDLRPAK